MILQSSLTAEREGFEITNSPPKLFTDYQAFIYSVCCSFLHSHPRCYLFCYLVFECLFLRLFYHLSDGFL